MATIVSKPVPSPYDIDFQERPDPVTQWLDAGCPGSKGRGLVRWQLVWPLALVCVVIAGLGMGNLYREHIAPVAVHHAVDN